MKHFIDHKIYFTWVYLPGDSNGTWGIFLQVTQKTAHSLPSIDDVLHYQQVLEINKLSNLTILTTFPPKCPGFSSPVKTGS